MACTKEIKIRKTVALYQQKNINEIAYDVGFENAPHFSRLFKKNLHSHLCDTVQKVFILANP